MFTISKQSKIATLIAGAALAASVSASAADRYIDGKVQSVDYATKSITVIEDGTGKLYTYAFTGKPQIDINGNKKRDMSLIEAGQDVALRLKKVEPVEAKTDFRLVKGEILEINRTQGLALIRPADGSSPRVIELPESVSISGLHSGAGVDDLKEGHFVTLKYTAL
ncbi:hypothetical protein QWI17_11955 [Gilvimarinus sp. SDUM040013]|uniref:DUF5666 domain-containing protein n=1 Tax=Gilvimarinus gilvus TaxID=3058038 RepID=A0ABU4RY13_9GAMM|nr:hypothetical protein [Gilvimarinus sp. SDUM040013]MDO3386550.1 hypothetical protein [Gilvimarinus sp. SDUM040013]MDX6849126.1 hypothetical protein [Gilvimarinus sp. SDUM040013]